MFTNENMTAFVIGLIAGTLLWEIYVRISGERKKNNE
jgi:hypothetical protein